MTPVGEVGVVSVWLYRLCGGCLSRVCWFGCVAGEGEGEAMSALPFLPAILLGFLGLATLWLIKVCEAHRRWLRRIDNRVRRLEGLPPIDWEKREVRR